MLDMVPSVEVRGCNLMGCTTVYLKEPLTETEMKDLQAFLLKQFSSRWGRKLRQHGIETKDGILHIRFGQTDHFVFEVEQTKGVVPYRKSPIAKRPKMKLVGEDGNIFAILGRASRLLKENGQPQQAKEMSSRVYQSGDYYKALNIISEYVETELSEKQPDKQKKCSKMER